VRLDVIGVPVEPVRVIGDNDLRAVVLDELERRAAACATGVVQNEPASSFCGQPIMPESR